MPNTKKTLKRNRGARNLTRNANRKAQNFVIERLQVNLTGSEIRNHARTMNMNKDLQNRVNRYLNSMGM